MKRRQFILSTAAAAGAGAALIPEACSSPGPGILMPGVGYTLNVGYTTATFGSYTLRTRTYNGATAGPTLEANPGTTLTIAINNTLPPNPPASVPMQRGAMVPTYTSMHDLMMRLPSGRRYQSGTIDPMNNPHAFNTTNLHVHGVQTVPHLFEPVGTADPAAMMIAIDPGQRKTYSFPIPIDHPGGLYWYHPHHHGSTDVQVSGGMAGLIIVRGAIDRVPEIAAARELTMVVQTLNVNGPVGGMYQYEPVAYQSATNPDGSTNPNAYQNLAAYTAMTVNGQGVLWINNNTNAAQTLSPPTITMQPGEVIRLRYLNGTNAWYLPLVFGELEAYIIGFDGVNVLTPLHKKFNFSGTVNSSTFPMQQPTC